MALHSPLGLHTSLAVLWVQGTESPQYLIMCYLNNAERHLFLRGKYQHKRQEPFYSPWEIYLFLNFKSQSILVRSLLHPLSSLRFEDLRSIFHKCQFIKQFTDLFPTVLSPPPSGPLACLTGSRHLPQEGLGAQYQCFCSH